ncbi:MAG TPA: KTSC domain-containing protein [Roseateles sp.]|uniref:KTSC domain-containing protein n=1 Tax=Roseateles sp. TaxID=1971397 RepID=UPI002ED97F3D
MPKDFKQPQAFEEGDAPHIDLHAVDSSKLAAVGYDASTQTLAVTFKTGNAVYHYPNVSPQQYADFIGAESVGKHFIAHFQSAPFKKYAIGAKAEA